MRPESAVMSCVVSPISLMRAQHEQVANARTGIPLPLHEDVEHHTVLVDGAP
jgi:beta-glucosidase-like glycosyl hydrolase